jgi:hypothetical protein
MATGDLHAPGQTSQWRLTQALDRQPAVEGRSGPGAEDATSNVARATTARRRDRRPRRPGRDAAASSDCDDRITSDWGDQPGRGTDAGQIACQPASLVEPVEAHAFLTDTSTADRVRHGLRWAVTGQ